MRGATKVLSATGLSLRFGRGGGAVEAVRSASLDVRSGEIVGIFGPSGCGKSSLLRLLSGLLRPTGGRVVYGGGRQRPEPGEIMPVWQDPFASLDSYWPIWRSITEPLMARQCRPWPDRRKRIAEAEAALESVGLAGVPLASRPRHLSGGQCQRVALARALIAGPRILVADEPTSALDVSAAAGVMHLLRAAAARGTGILIVSHDRQMLGSLCDRRVEMSEGRLGDP